MIRIRSTCTVAALALAAALPARAQCLTTFFGANGGSALGGAMYFDVDAAAPCVVDRLESNFQSSAGAAVGLEVWVRTGTYSGFETSPLGWSLASRDDGFAVAQGWDQPTPVRLDPGWELPAGLTGVALVAVNTSHARTNGSGTNQLFSDGFMSLTLGSSSNVPFAPAVFVPRVWNGTLCYRPLVGAAVCSPAAANSTGAPGRLVATGAVILTANDLDLTAFDLPAAAATLGLAARSTALIPTPGGSRGTLCLGGPIGRFVPQVTLASNEGYARVAVDLTSVPTPTGLVAVQPGETWWFQAWYRDVGPTGATSNFTNAVRLGF